MYAHARSQSIDILRAVSIFLVLGRHMEPCPAEVNIALHDLTRTWQCGGWIGVDLFFVISGFLVSGLLFREYQKNQRFDVPRFLIRRGLKIYPSFWLLIAVTLAIRNHKSGMPSWAGILSEVLFVQNYWAELWPHTWSLAVEEHFYLILIFAMTSTACCRPEKLVPRVAAAVGLIAIACLSLRILNDSLETYDQRTHLFPTHLRLDSLAFGVFIASLFTSKPAAFMRFANTWRWALMITGLALLSPPFLIPLGTGNFLHTTGLSMFYLGSGAVLVAALSFAPSNNRMVRAFAFIGSQSYSIYLWHMAMTYWIADYILLKQIADDLSWHLYSFVYISGSVCVGILMGRLVEGPVLNFRDKFFPSSLPQVSTGSTIVAPTVGSKP